MAQKQVHREKREHVIRRYFSGFDDRLYRELTLPNNKVWWQIKRDGEWWFLSGQPNLELSEIKQATLKKLQERSWNG